MGNFLSQSSLFCLILVFAFSGLQRTSSRLVSADNECLDAPYIYIDMHGGDSDDPSDTNQIFMYSRNGCNLGTILSETIESQLNEPRGLVLSSAENMLFFANANKDDSFIAKTAFSKSNCNANNQVDSFSVYIPGTTPGLVHPYGVLEIKEENLLFVTNQDTNSIMWFELDTGKPKPPPTALYARENNIKNETLHINPTLKYKSIPDEYRKVDRKLRKGHKHKGHDKHEKKHKSKHHKDKFSIKSSSSEGIFHQFDDVESQDVRGITYDPSRQLIFVSKEADGVIVFDYEGNIQTVIDNEGSIGINYSIERSSIFVGSKDDDSVKEYLVPSFKLYQTFTGDEIDHPAGLDVHKGTTIYVLSQNTYSIVAIDIFSGEMTTIVKNLSSEGEALVLGEGPCQ